MYKIVKRLIDFVLAFIGIVILSPLFIIVSILIKIDSKGSIIFSQERVGQFAKPFHIYKFRTMVANASKIGPTSTATNDARITKVGRILRTTSLDELPQLFNILLGNMSIVGFRPGVRGDYTENELKSELFNVKPGITGYAQVNGRSSLEPEEKRAYEMEYVKKISFLTDIKIILKTVKVVLFRKGTN